MRKRTHKILSYFFLGIFAFNMCVYYVLMSVSDMRMKYEMGMDIKNEKLHQAIQVIQVPVTSAKTYSQDEVWYNHKLYDVVKRETKGHVLYIYLLHDSNEEGLLAKVTGFVEHEFGSMLHSNSAAKHPAKNMSKIPAQEYVQEGAHSNMLPGTFSNYYLHTPLTVFYKNIYSYNLTPPPKVG